MSLISSNHSIDQYSRRLRALAPLRDRNPYMHIFNPDAILTGKERRESKDTKKEAWSIVGSMNKRALDAVAEAVT